MNTDFVILFALAIALPYTIHRVLWVLIRTYLQYKFKVFPYKYSQLGDKKQEKYIKYRNITFRILCFMTGIMIGQFCKFGLEYLDAQSAQHTIIKHIEDQNQHENTKNN